jgi:hypothetical protein
MRTHNLTVHRKDDDGRWIYVGDLLADGSTTGFEIDDNDALLPSMPDNDGQLRDAQRVWELREETVNSFGAGARLMSAETDDHWAAFTRQLSDAERGRQELQGDEAGFQFGLELLAINNRS